MHYLVTIRDSLFCSDDELYKFSYFAQSERSMKDIRDCYWSYVLFEDIGGCSPRGSGYIALQYWGNRFHSPASHPYYFVIEMGEDNVPSFKIGPNEIALQYGRLAVQAANL